MENFHSCVCIMRHLGEIIFNSCVCWSIGRFLHFCSISLRSTSQGAVVARFISYCRFCLLYRPFEGGCWSIPFIQVNKCKRRWTCLLAGVGYGQLRRGRVLLQNFISFVEGNLPVISNLLDYFKCSVLSYFTRACRVGTPVLWRVVCTPSWVVCPNLT